MVEKVYKWDMSPKVPPYNIKTYMIIINDKNWSINLSEKKERKQLR